MCICDNSLGVWLYVLHTLNSVGGATAMQVFYNVCDKSGKKRKLNHYMWFQHMDCRVEFPMHGIYNDGFDILHPHVEPYRAHDAIKGVNQTRSTFRNMSLS